MFRREFFQRMTLAGAGGLATAGAAGAGSHKTVTYRVKGFSCVTCAVGLDTMLRQQRGVIRSKSSYAEATAVIEFDPGLLTEESLKAFISGMGFAVG